MIVSETYNGASADPIGVRAEVIEGQAMYIAHMTLGHAGDRWFVIEGLGMSESEAIKAVIRKAVVLTNYLDEAKRDFAPKLLRQRAEDERELLAQLQSLGVEPKKKDPQN